MLLHLGFSYCAEQQDDECLTPKPAVDLSKQDGVTLFRKQQRASCAHFNCGIKNVLKHHLLPHSSISTNRQCLVYMKWSNL